ncbi:MAG: molecular chaperone DnaK [Bdellovibrionota bacterium]|nr:molecular chaperone DnaK [Deltaproteobacteria bacterium]
MGKVIGIDLGTTNSCVAFTEGRHTNIILNKNGYPTTASVVAILENGKVVVGQVAKRQAIANPENTIISAKRLIGRRIGSKEVEHAKALYTYKIVEGPHDDVRIRAQKREFSLPEISSYILLELKRVAEDYFSEPVTDAVITVPAHFNDAQRQATKDAGKIAGLNVLRIINEPTAAAIAYGFSKKKDQTVVVYDLGGGTFDISILEIHDGVFKVIATGGDTFLGGDDFDGELIDYVAGRFIELHDVDLRKDKIALQRLKDGCERAKCDLSTFREVEINLPFIATKNEEPLHLNVTIDRKLLEKLCKKLVDRTLKICEAVMQEAKLTKDSLTDILLVGGQTRMPFLADQVSNFFGRSASKQINPDEAVAVGASIQGNALTADTEVEMLLLDVTPLPLGIRSAGGTFTQLIDANTTVPVLKKKTFTTVVNNQPSVRVQVYQGFSPIAEENELLGEFVLEGIRKASAGEPEIEVTFHIDANGIVQVSARDLDTKKEQSIRVTMSSGLTENEIDEIAQQAQSAEMVLRDEEESESLAQKNELLLYKVRKIFLTKKNMLDPARIKQVQMFMSHAQSVIARKDIEELRKLYNQLQETHQQLDLDNE